MYLGRLGLPFFSCLLMSVGTPSPSSPSSPSMAWRSIPPFLRHASSLAGRTSVLPHISLHYGTLIYHDIPMPIGTHRYDMWLFKNMPICKVNKISNYSVSTTGWLWTMGTRLDHTSFKNALESWSTYGNPSQNTERFTVYFNTKLWKSSSMVFMAGCPLAWVVGMVPQNKI